MKNRTIIIAALALILILATIGCTRLFGSKETTQPTTALTPVVPLMGDTPGMIVSVTAPSDKLPAATQVVPPTATPVIEVQQPTAVPQATAAPVESAITVPIVQAAASYPESPETVVSAFLAAYRDNPADMNTYLSSGFIAGLPAGGAAQGADLSGSLEDFIIQSGSASENPPYAVVQVSIRLNGVDTVRIFQLTRENNLWKINMVDIARG